jgi:hypothetical protein
MKSSQSANGSKRHHYCKTAPEAAAKIEGATWRVPAHDVEALGLTRLRTFLNDASALHAVVAMASINAEALNARFVGRRASQIQWTAIPRRAGLCYTASIFTMIVWN